MRKGQAKSALLADKATKMNHRHYNKVEVSPGPCPPEEFAGRFDERKQLLAILSEVKKRGQVVVVSGARGSGKTSFLDWAEYEIQDKSGGLGSPVIKKAFLETPGMIFATYKDLLTELRGHQKFSWFRKALDNPNVRRSIEAVLGVLEGASSVVGPGKLGVELGFGITRGFLPAQMVQYSQLLSSFLEVFRNLSKVLEDNRFITILCDDAQWSSDPDFHLLKDLIRNLPRRIAFIVTFRLETDYMEKYIKLRGELDRFGHKEIRLTAMTADEVKDLATRRYCLSIDNPIADFLSSKIGDPLCLVSCFNLLQRRNLEPNLDNIQQILSDVVDPARCIYSELDEQWQGRVNSLCILHPPLPLPLIACMLGVEQQDIVRLQDELNQSFVFQRLGKQFYDFAHPSLREYRRKELPEGVLIGLHAKAARCFEALADKLADKWSVVLALAEHLFFGQEYEKALELNLAIGDRLYDLFDFSSALLMTDRARTCAEKTNNKPMLAVALHQKGLILQSDFRFPDSLDAYNQSLAIKREIGDESGEAVSLRTIKALKEKMGKKKGK
ncbi:MAG: ATP-binding protein [Dehalococcoidales bacterium]|nr:ATP-binding protein [Dehalococcoidales bacterium]